jgi:hypothetical protein
VAELNARLGPWTFVIPAYNKTSFQKAKSDLLKPVAPPHEGAPGSSKPNDETAPPEETKPAPPEGKPDEPPKDPESKPPGF